MHMLSPASFYMPLTCLWLSAGAAASHMVQLGETSIRVVQLSKTSKPLSGANFISPLSNVCRRNSSVCFHWPRSRRKIWTC
ncbi:hypothetical protein C8R45DRAFT_184211 [Mycena sanguinolenta]|nr:hypothetical protein C8R45DRAFT_184211 [Mycena sanguinolenta]